MPKQPLKKTRLKIDTTETKIADSELPSMLLGEFLRPSADLDGKNVVIKSPAYIVSSRFGRHRVVGVLLGGRRYAMRLNSISLRNLVDEFGADSEDWVDKVAVIRVQEILGKRALVLEPSTKTHP